jgi:type I restriction enzyme R subunit
VLVDKSFLRKTAELVRKHTRTSVLIAPDRIYHLTPEVLDSIASADDTSDTVKVFNLLKAIHALVDQQGAEAPYLISIGERAEKIAQAFQERQITTQQTLADLRRLVEQYKQAEQERQGSQLTKEGFGVYWILQNENIAEAEQAAQETEGAFAEFPHWQHSAEQERSVRLALYKALIKTSAKERMVEIVDQILNVLKRAAHDG